MTTFEQQLNEALSNNYDIERELGGGGMSRVFVAIEKSLGRKVVIKLLSPELTAEVNRGRFRREIQVAAQLQHPHIVPLLSAGEHGDLVYYTMPFIKGESLKSAVETNGPLSVNAVVRVLYDVVDALAYAHENGVVHRDIKPANILRSGSHSLVTDFGVAKALNAAMPSGQMTSTGMAIGTPAYMSPEQLAGDPAANHRIDIYAVGLLAYELLTGKSPFAASTPRGVLAAVLTREPTPLMEVRPEVPRAFSEMVMSCLAKEPDARPQEAQDLLAALDMFSSSGEIRTREYRLPSTGANPATPTAAATPPLTTAPSAVSGTTAIPTPQSSGTVTAPAISAGGDTAPEVIATAEAPALEKPRKNKTWIGLSAIAVPVIAGAIFLFARDKSPAEVAPPLTPLVSDSAATDSAAMAASVAAAAPAPPPAVVPVVDSQAIRDSLRKIALAKKAAAAKADSIRAQATSQARPATEPSRGARAARWAAAALLADANARTAFIRGATSKGGLLGKRRRGDLQTQIDALQPFLSKYGLTYDQFKQIVQGSGINVYDEFGRMVLAEMERFASSPN
jgi:serine/threonine-protein kinase